MNIVAIRKLSVVLVALGLSSPTVSLRAQQPGTAIPHLAVSLDASPVDLTVAAIEGAERQILVVVYKFDEPELFNALEAAMARGVHVRIIADAEEAGRKRSLVDDSQMLGAVARRWVDGKLHAKFAVIDDDLVLSGSYNWTKSAAEDNVELFLASEDPEVVKEFADLFESLWVMSPVPGGARRE